MNNIIQSVWIGDRLSPMEQVSIQSYLRHGHEFHLYTYGPVENVPAGAEIRNANEIIPYAELPYTNFKSMAAFSDYFRYKLLFDRGGFYVDTDTVCLRPFDFQEEYVFSTERLNTGAQINGAYLKAPAGSPVMKFCWDRCLMMQPADAQNPWGRVGPSLITEAVKVFKLSHFAKPPDIFNPVNWFDMQFLDKPGPLNLPASAYAVHLWNEMWSRYNMDKHAFHPDSPYNQLRILSRPLAYRSLIAVVSCSQEKYCQRVRAQREMWFAQAKRFGFDVEVFDGSRLGVGDGYLDLISKTKALSRWAYDHGYEHMLKTDDDAWIAPERLVVPTADYAGIRIKANSFGWRGSKETPDKPAGTFPCDYASGGAYWLTRRSMKFIVEETKINDWAEDRWVGHLLQRNGIPFVELPNYILLWQISLGECLRRNPVVVTQFQSVEEMWHCNNMARGLVPMTLGQGPPQTWRPPVRSLDKRDPRYGSLAWFKE